MVGIIQSIVAIVLILLLVIGLHELGHFIAARCLGVKVKRVVLGLGKPFYTYTLPSQLELCITPFPCGGYVKLLNEREAPVAKSDLPYSFTHQKPWRRIVILLAGAVVNLLVAFVIYFGLLLWGLTEKPPIVGEIAPQSIAAEAGLKAGDEIQSIDGWKTPNWSLTLLAIISHSGNNSPMNVTVKQVNGHIKALSFAMTGWHFNGSRQTPLESFGIDLPEEIKSHEVRLPFTAAFQQGAYRTYQYVILNLHMMKQIVTRQIALTALSGPMTLVSAAKSELDVGLERFLQFIALLSIAVGMVNLLPLPSLDGGHILFVVLEKLRGKPLSVDVEVLIYRFMMAALFIFCMQLVANDLDRYAHSLKQAASQVRISE